MLKDKLLGYKLILASQSPRRRQLLSDMGLTYEIRLIPDIDESFSDQLHKQEVAMFLSRHKFDNYLSTLATNELLITADTIVCLEDKIINKPENELAAFEMLKSLSGTMHQVFTGMTIGTILKQDTFFCETKVYFKELTDEEIWFYIHTFKPFDKAGSYGIQEFIGYIGIEKIDGSYFNVMGLPTHLLYEKLHKFVE